MFQNSKQLRFGQIRAAMALIMVLAGPLAWADRKPKADLKKLVVIGDSLSAGFLNFSLLGTQQVHGYASVVATQANTDLVLPSINCPGLPNVLQLTPAMPFPMVAPVPDPPLTLMSARMFPWQQATDLAVPAHKVQDTLTTRPDLASLPLLPPDQQGPAVLTFVVLGIPGSPAPKSQIEWAESLSPTTLIVWAGNNDVLLSAMNGTAAEITPAVAFAKSYAELLDRASEAAPTVIVANIPDITKVPFLVPALKVSALLHQPLAVLAAAYGIVPGSYITIDALAGIARGLIPPGPLADKYLVTPAEAAAIRDATDLFNKIIHREAAKHHAVLVDINSLVDEIAANGYNVGGFLLTTDFLGGLFSLDGVHPTYTGNAIVANEFIRTMNKRLHLEIPPASVEAVAMTDPLVPWNLPLPMAPSTRDEIEAAIAVRQ